MRYTKRKSCAKPQKKKRCKSFPKTSRWFSSGFDSHLGNNNN